MQLKPQQLAGALQKKLASIYLISGDEPQQISELSDLVRATAKDRGFLCREIYFVDKQFNWLQLGAATDTLSLFDDKKIIELKLPEKLDTPSSQALADYCRHSPDDNLMLLTSAKLSKESQKQAWFQAVDQLGCAIQVWPLAGQELLRWLEEKLRQRGMTAESDALRLLADKTEGNLLAAAQDIEKLFVLHGPVRIGKAQVTEMVADNSRYDVFQLVESVLAARVDKALKILASLKAEGLSPAIVVWAIAREARLLVGYKSSANPELKDRLLKANNVWGDRKQLVELSAKKLSHVNLNHVLALAAKADRQLKGQELGDVWGTLLDACLNLSGAVSPTKLG